MNRRHGIVGIIILIVLTGAVGFALATQDRTQSDTPLAEHDNPPHAQRQDTQGQESTPAATTSSVAIVDFAFTPKTITVTKGTTVTWTNDDTIAHTVTATKGDGPQSKLFGKDETYKYAFDKAGTFDYYCKPHPNMTGTVIVTEK